jgi:hypothetical protein
MVGESSSYDLSGESLFKGYEGFELPVGFTPIAPGVEDAAIVHFTIQTYQAAFIKWRNFRWK